MARKIITKKDKIDELNAIDLNEREPELTAELFTASISESAGGSISASKGALVQSKDLDQWLTQIRADMKNPFVGKSYMVRASEYETESKIIHPGKVKELDKELESEINAGAEAYDPNTAKSPVAEDRKSIRDDGNFSTKLIDHCVVTNLTRRLINRSTDELLELAQDELRNHHGDSEYITPIDIEKSIEKTRYDMLLLDDKSETKKLK
jgi:hypothetical protein